MLTFKGRDVIRLTLTAEVHGRNGATQAVFAKSYISEGGEVGRVETHPHPDLVPELVQGQHRIFERAGYVVDEENEKISTNGENHWSLTRVYRLAEQTNT